MKRTHFRLLVLALAIVAPQIADAQDRLPRMPGFDRYDRMRREIGSSVKRGSVRVEWLEEGKFFRYTWGGKTLRYDVAARKSAEDKAGSGADPEPRTRAAQNPERGRQFAQERSPDGKWTALHRDGNVFLKPSGGGPEIQATTAGSSEKRIKCGIASWVYGEELSVRHAMWWSPDSSMLAYYVFDESEVKDYYLALSVTKVQNSLDVEPYPKAGTPNPRAALWVYHLATKSSVQLTADFGSDGKDIGYYLYDVRWSPEGGELLFHRTNRKQNVMELCAADPKSGACRTIVREEWKSGWTENSPSITWMDAEPGKRRRFLWISERSGFRNIYEGDLEGKPLRPITQQPFEVVRILRYDKGIDTIWYLARSADNPYRFQLHRVRSDGTAHRRLTDPSLHHAVDVAPGGRHFVDIAEKLDTPPETRLVDASTGKVLDVLAKSDLAKFEQLGLKKGELVRFKAADGETDCYGTLHRPSNFDPSKKYPLLVSVYGGPDSSGGGDSFEIPPAITEFGFLVANFDGRGTNGRGKAFKDALYGKLGIVEIDDQAAGVRSLTQRPYVDGKRVGIHGTSYGGYSSAMCILRHPDLFQVAVASSSVTDWRNYDTIYTERYMGLPWENENLKGYDEGSAMKYAANLKGRLMLFYGTADNNVHPSNTYQLVQSLMRSGKSFDMMAGPDQGHSGLNQTRTWEYFVHHLIIHPDEAALPSLHAAWRTRAGVGSPRR